MNYRLITVPQAAVIAGVTAETAYRWIRNGTWAAPLVVRFGRTIRIREPILERMMNEGGTLRDR